MAVMGWRGSGYFGGDAIPLARCGRVPPSAPELPVSAQEEEKPGLLRRYLNHILAEGADPATPKWIHYPTLAYTPETSWEIGVSSLHIYSANRDVCNRLSEVKAFTFCLALLG